MSNDKKPEGDGPKIDWAYQAKYTLFLIVGIVAFLALMRFLGLRG